MIDEGMTLVELVEKAADIDPVREMLGIAAERMMDVEAEVKTCAAKGARMPLWEAQRTGYRDRDWWRRARKRSGGSFPRRRRAGRIALDIPKLRKGGCFPSFLEPRRTAGKALAAVMQEACVHGSSTRSVDGLVKAMGVGGMSKSQASRLCADIAMRANAFLQRPLESAWGAPLSLGPCMGGSRGARGVVFGSEYLVGRSHVYGV